MLRERQKSKLEKILNINETKQSNQKWKILIYDDAGLSILTSYFDPDLLSNFGITFHSHIDTPRTKIENVSTIYFVDSTFLISKKISKDISEGLYDEVSINFTSKVSKNNLHKLAELISKSSNCNSIKNIFDQHIDFKVIDHIVFEILPDDSLNKSLFSFNATESDLNKAYDIITKKLISVSATFGEIPYIAYQLDSPILENLASKLTAKLSKLPKTLIRSESRPLLLLFNRSSDIAIPLHHSFTYGSLVNDILTKDSINHITIKGEEHTLDENNDSFWYENQHLLFGDVLNNTNKYVTKLQKQIESIKSNAAVMFSQRDSIISKQDISALHTEICNSMIEPAKHKHLLLKEEFHMFSRISGDFSELQKTLNTIKDINDRERIILISYLFDTLSQDNIEKLKQSPIDIPNIVFQLLDKMEFERLKVLKKSSGSLKEFFESKYGEDEYEFRKYYPIVNKIKKVINGNYKNLKVIDPLGNDAVSINVKPKNVIAFVVGSGCVAEADGVYWINEENKSAGVGVIYGCTKMLTPNNFLEELNKFI